MENLFSWAGTVDLSLTRSQTLTQDSRYTRYARLFLFLGLLLYTTTALVNTGIIAIDDYEYGVSRAVPAQMVNFSSIIRNRDVRSPLPSLWLATLSKSALHLGIVDPVWQLRFVLVLLGLFSLSMQAYFGASHFPKGSRSRAILLFLLSFYFLCPLFFSRLMIESLSAPFLMASAYFACVYFRSGKAKSIALSVVLLTVASMLRFQAGVCIVALFLVLLLRPSLKAFGTFFLTAIACFFLSGFADWSLTGGFHSSLVTYFKYNVLYSSGYGVEPWYLFILLFLGLSLPPALIGRYRGFEWRRVYGPLVPTLLYFVVFLIAHSLIPHKEERFVIPVLGLYLLLLTPLADYWMEQGGLAHWRVRLFLLLNFLLLPLVSFNVVQNNAIGLVRYFQHHPHFTTVYGVDGTLVLYPSALSLHAPKAVLIERTALPAVEKNLTCDQAIAVRQDIAQSLPELSHFSKLGQFNPGFLEGLIVKMNPKRNGRRGPIELFGKPDC